MMSLFDNEVVCPKCKGRADGFTTVHGNEISYICSKCGHIFKKPEVGKYKTTVIVEAYQSNKEFDIISETGREHVNVGDWIVKDLETYEEHVRDPDTFQKKYEQIS